MPTLKIAGAQMDIAFESPEANYKTVERLAKNAADAGVDLLVLPEMFSTGFSMNKGVIAESPEGRTMTFLRKLARQMNMNILGGYVQQRNGQEAYNMAVIVDRYGQLVHEYAKVRLFSLGGEANVLTPGRALSTCEIEGMRIAAFVCYDLRFPELFREVARQVDVAIVIASWPKERMSHWNCLLKARAIENQQYVVGVNRIGLGGGILYDGGTTIIAPNGEVLKIKRGEEALVMCQIDNTVVAEIRREYPFLSDMT